MMQSEGSKNAEMKLKQQVNIKTKKHVFIFGTYWLQILAHRLAIPRCFVVSLVLAGKCRNNGLN
jgi:hypothetical protein